MISLMFLNIDTQDCPGVIIMFMLWLPLFITLILFPITVMFLLTSVSWWTTLKTANYEKKPVRGANQSGSQFKSVLLT